MCKDVQEASRISDVALSDENESHIQGALARHMLQGHL